MSRTDKDAPYWVRVEYYEPVHDHCPNQPPHVFRWARRTVTRECDLPAVPVRRNRGWSRTPHLQACRWEPAGGWDRKYYTRPPGREDRHVYFHSPNRRMTRDFCVKARQAFNGSGIVDLVEPYPSRTKLDWWD